MFQKFKHFSLSVYKYIVGYQDWNSQNACQKSKQVRPWSDCFFKAMWSGIALFVLAFEAGNYCSKF